MPFLSPNQQRQSTEGNNAKPTHTKLNLNLTNRQIKNYPHLCAHHCAQLSYTTQHKQFWLTSLLASKQLPQLTCCLLEGEAEDDQVQTLQQEYKWIDSKNWLEA